MREYKPLSFLEGITPYNAVQPLICMELLKKKVHDRNNIYIKQKFKGNESSI